MVSNPKGKITTLNATSYGPLCEYLEECSSKVVAVQEHHATREKLGEVQARALDLGWHGVWSPACPTEGGSQGGVAVLAPSNITSLARLVRRALSS